MSELLLARAVAGLSSQTKEQEKTWACAWGQVSNSSDTGEVGLRDRGVIAVTQ